PASPASEPSTRPHQVGVYYFPNYHPDPRNEAVHGTGWTEWELVKLARPRFEGHRQPRTPVWGYENEADPAVMARKIAVAAAHGVDFWIFDWYWYDDGPFLNRCLEEGYFGAAEAAAPGDPVVKFCCMWANHDWLNIHPAKYADPREVLYPGQVTPATFERMTDHIITRYFTHPWHFSIDGCPYFSIYELGKLVASFGSVEATRRALDSFRARTRAAGFPDLHLNAVVWGRPVLPGETTPADPAFLLDALGFDSFTSYVWIHHVALPDFPQTPFAYVRDRYFEYWEQAEERLRLPYFPNLSVGWDSSPRTVQSDGWANVGYPFTAVISENTPEAFHEAALLLRQRLDQSSTKTAGARIVTVNAWNEWTEGSYLEPDTTYGLAYLEALRDAFT
ncbi:MAG: glycoside hydrolase family 99-like domain-containing protein, partial [Armatimonadetes bacterium]|nr:glycoside hydrolase family 99-like domain-containing protein [Armatimonadota bacterium]